MSSALTLDNLGVIIGFGGAAFGAAFWFAALEIKAKINLEIARQLSDIALSQAAYQNKTVSDLENLASKMRGWIDSSATKIGVIEQRIDQIEGYLEDFGKNIGQGHHHVYRQRPRLNVDEILPEDTKF